VKRKAGSSGPHPTGHFKLSKGLYTLCIDLVNISHKLKGLTASEHSILNVLAHRAEKESQECWPSARSLCESTSQDIKTIYKSLISLEDKKYIIKTGKMAGKTKSVPVYKLYLSVPKNGCAQNLSVPVFSDSVPKNGCAKRTQKRYMERSDLKDQRKEDFSKSKGPKTLKDILQKIKPNT
jgi:pyocin large subunit-like protein